MKRNNQTSKNIFIDIISKKLKNSENWEEDKNIYFSLFSSYIKASINVLKHDAYVSKKEIHESLFNFERK